MRRSGSIAYSVQIAFGLVEAAALPLGSPDGPDRFATRDGVLKTIWCAMASGRADIVIESMVRQAEVRLQPAFNRIR
jgi:hypothetical protein